MDCHQCHSCLNHVDLQLLVLFGSAGHLTDSQRILLTTTGDLRKIKSFVWVFGRCAISFKLINLVSSRRANLAGVKMPASFVDD
jgi:hypothetical protein